MNLLLDTHILIRILNGDTSLSSDIISNANYKTNNIYISVASLWEMSIKISLKKLVINGTFEDILNVLQKNLITVLPIEHVHLTALLDLPWLHKDPFDRLIIAQSLVQKLTLITDDNYIRSYPDIQIL